MKTKLSESNPFGYDRYAFAFENIKESDHCLDYGCYDGKFISNVLSNKKNISYVGVDKNINIINQNPYKLELKLLEDDLPYKSSFDFISILDVIEHIHLQGKVLRQLNDILKMGGVLVITAPKKNFFSFLDLGNYKFVFPGLHKVFYTIRHSKEAYEARYLNNPSGLIGDVEKEKAWHQHFSEQEMEELLKVNGFQVEKFDGSGFLQRIFSVLDLLKIGKLLPRFIRKWDSKYFENSNLFCRAIKVKETNELTQ